MRLDYFLPAYFEISIEPNTQTGYYDALIYKVKLFYVVLGLPNFWL